MCAERGAVAHESAEIFRVRQRINGDEQLRPRTARQNLIERGGRGNFADGEDALKQREAGERHQKPPFREINSDLFRTRFEQRAEFIQMLLGEHDGDDGETALEQAAHDLFALSHEDALRFMFRRAAHCAIRREFGLVERGNLLNVKHKL
jgi:hypothetical protein